MSGFCGNDRWPRVADRGTRFSNLQLFRFKIGQIYPFSIHLWSLLTFHLDGFRMWYNWNDERHNMIDRWNCSHYTASAIVLIILLGQVFGSLMLFLRYRVKPICLLMGFIMVLQDFVYWDSFPNVLDHRSISLSGLLLLLFAEEPDETERIRAHVPSLRKNKSKSYILLSGRILVTVMLFNTFCMKNASIRLTNVSYWINILASTLMNFVWIGWKTESSAFYFAMCLMAGNLFDISSFYTTYGRKLGNHICRILGVVGGLVQIFLVGPGSVSIDELKSRSEKDGETKSQVEKPDVRNATTTELHPISLGAGTVTRQWIGKGKEKRAVEKRMLFFA